MARPGEMSGSTTISPVILRLDWGRMEVDGLGAGKDFKLWPGGGREWDWSETGTHHDPGIQAADLKELVASGSRVVVLSRGMLLRLKTSPEARAYLDEQGIAYHIEETQSAADLYNALAERGELVGGLFHSTC